MDFSRRQLIAGLGASSVAGAVAPVTPEPPSLPDWRNFRLPGVYLDAAFVHPIGQWTYAAASVYLADRLRDPSTVGPGHNPRSAAVERFARLINAAPEDIAVVPSTLEGENLIVESLGVGRDAGVVTDALHYDASLILYAELGRRGMPVAIARLSDNRIKLEDIRSLITPKTRLIAVSLVASDTGFEHDLAELCSVAHERGALVYADIIQAAGATPIDVKASGVDFCCCGTYKWLMGEFGTAFLYVRPDRLERLRRVQVGWRQVRSLTRHIFPFDPPGPVTGSYEFDADAAGLFEVSTPSWAALAIVAGSLDYLSRLGIEAIVRHRQPLLDRLQTELPRYGFLPLTPTNSRSSIAAFAFEGVQQRWGGRLQEAGFRLSMHPNRIRVSPSVYNSMDDIERLLEVFAS